MSSQNVYVHQGEASESSEDERIAEVVHPKGNNQAGVVVAGEASESSSDESEVTNSRVAVKELRTDTKDVDKSNDEVDSPVPLPTSPVLSTEHIQQPKYIQTPVHNSDMYTSASKEVTNITSHAGKSHSVMRDVSQTMSLTSNDLFKLEDKMDIIATCSILPDLRLPTVELPATTP